MHDDGDDVDNRSRKVSIFQLGKGVASRVAYVKKDCSEGRHSYQYRVCDIDIQFSLIMCPNEWTPEQRQKTGKGFRLWM